MRHWSWFFALVLVLAGLPVAAQPPAPPVQGETPAPDTPPSEPAAPAPDEFDADGDVGAGDAPPAPVAPSPAEVAEEEALEDALEEEALEEEALEEEVLEEEEDELGEGGAIRVTGERLLESDELVGSSHVIDERQLRAAQPFSPNEILRRVPGVSLRDEDGVGFRTNVGFRGLSPDRSRNLLVLEDGVPIQMGPYGEPEMYYSPRLDRMRAIEIVKGAGSILYGPRTTGGALNFVTLDPPDELEARASLQIGNYGLYLANASVGDTVGNVGYLITATNLHFAGNRGQDAVVTDVMGKVRIDLGEAGVLRIKLQGYSEDSDTTYLGLTTGQFEHDPHANYADNDHMRIRRFAATVGHVVDLGEHVQLQTTAYFSQLERDWRRQDYVRDQSGLDPSTIDRAVCSDGPTSLASATNDFRCVYFLNSTGNRNRGFTVYGVESRMRFRFGHGHELVAGARAHHEGADEQFIIGDSPASTSGTIRTHDRRSLFAFAAYAQMSIAFASERVHLTPGVRIESISSHRTIFRDNSVDFDPAQNKRTYLFAPIPGLSLTVEATDALQLFTGVHRGFSPPRIKDSISATGMVLNLSAEYSWNFELGARVHDDRGFSAEIAAFAVDFSNQILSPEDGSGGASSGSILNGGHSRQLGVESSMAWDLARAFDFGGEHAMQLPVELAYTYVDARFLGGWGIGYSGNFIPYSPQHRFSATVTDRIDVTVDHRLELQVHGDYVSQQFADPFNTLVADADLSGLLGTVPARFLLDARIGYTYVPWGVTAALAGKNLTNHTYVASRAPAGIQPGMPLQIMGTISVTY